MNLLMAIILITVLSGGALFSPAEAAAKDPALDVPYEPTSYDIAKEM